MKFALALSYLICLNVVFAQDSVSVLFIGNSYTYFNNMPQLLEDIASSKGDIVYQSSQVAGGATFNYHANNAATYAAINSEPWDFVVLQAQSQEPSFPDNQVNTETLPYAEQMADSIYANNFCSEALFFMTWGRENGDPQWAPISTFEGMNDRLRSAYMRFADSTQGAVSPVGSAWRYVRENYPAIDLYSADGSHPSLEGSYLAACTFYASVFRKTPVGATYISTLDPVVAGQLQSAAEITVLDSLDQWNLRPISEHTQAEFTFGISGNQVDFTNLSTKALNYEWSFGDGNTDLVEHPVHTFATDGNYPVELIAISPCDADTVSYTVVINTASIGDLNSGYKLKTLACGEFVIEFNNNINSYSLMNSEGKEIQAKLTVTDQLHLNLSNYEKGMYFLRADRNGESYMIKLYH